MVQVRSMIKVLAATALVAALAAPGDARTLKPAGGWDLGSTAKTCTMSTTFSDDVTIALIWAPSTSELGFMATLPLSYGLKAQKTAPIELSFDGTAPYRDWQDERADVLHGEDSVGVMANWGAGHANDLANAVKSASHVHIRVGDRDLGSYDLAGSPVAYQALMHCGTDLAAK